MFSGLKMRFQPILGFRSAVYIMNITNMLSKDFSPQNNISDLKVTSTSGYSLKDLK